MSNPFTVYLSKVGQFDIVFFSFLTFSFDFLLLLLFTLLESLRLLVSFLLLLSSFILSSLFDDVSISDLLLSSS